VVSIFEQQTKKPRNCLIVPTDFIIPLGLKSSQDVVGLDLNSVSDKWKVLETKARVAGDDL
jgi:hypothetical protein